MSEIKKKYNHFAIESDLLKKNYFQKLFATKKWATKRESVITQFPIEISKNTSLHTITDLIKESVIATYQRMKGIKIHLLPIFDTENKDLKIENYENLLIKAGIFFGIDTDNIVYSERNTNFIRNLFVELVNEGHIYEDYSINYRSINEQKTLGTDELQRKKVQTKEYNLRYFVDTKNISLIIPTIQPETIFADVALAVHPNDKRYKKLTKNKVIIPIINKTIPIIADESVDPTKGTGIIRITPAHDKKSLIIAQKHGLQIDKFAIDKNGCFTQCAGDFSGKNINEFTKNIIKNLDDIHNLESTKHVEVEIPVHRKTWEKVRPLLCNQRFIKIEKEIKTIQEAIQEKKLSIIPEYSQENIANTIQTIEYRPITKEDSKGYCLPLRKSKNGKSYFISDNEFLNLPIKKTKNKYTVLSLIIFNLIVDRRLKQHFSIEECIDVLLGTNLTGEQTTLETYIELFNETLPRGYSKELNELKKIIEYAQKEKWTGYFEKFSIGLMNILDKSIAINSKKRGFYYLNVDLLTPNDEGLVLQKKKIEDILGHGLILIKMMEAFNDTKKEPKKIFSINEQKLFEFLKILVIGENIQGKILFDECMIQKNTPLTKTDKESFKDLIKNYGTDCTRMYAINPTKNITDYEQFMTKLRNASRFITQQRYDKKSTKKINNFLQLTTQLEKKKNELSEFETWIISKVNEIQKEYEEAMNKATLGDIQEKIIHIIREDFCDKYLEIKKHQNTENGEKVTLRCLGTFLKLLHPFIPFLTQYIWDILELEWAVMQQTIEEMTAVTKNYKTQLFMDIIDRFLILKQKNNYAKHESVDICFFAPLDFLQYLRKQEHILAKLINTSSIEYLESEKQLWSYQTENIINITIGIKTHQKEIRINKKENLHEILCKKEQELQGIRSLITGLSTNGTDPEIIREKKREINKLKKEIDEIKYQIQKEKVRK